MTFLSTIYSELTLAYFILSVLVLVRNPRAELNRFASFLLFSLGLWGVGLIGFHLSPRLAKHVVQVWGNVSSVGAYTCSSFFLLFVLALTGHRSRLRQPYLYVLLFGLPLACIIVQWTNEGAALLQSGPFGWRLKWQYSVWTWIYFTYLTTFLGAGLVLLAHRALTDRRPEMRQQATLIFWTMLVTQVLSTTTDIVLPILKVDSLPPLAVALAVIWAVGLFVSMVRYGLMPVTAQVAARDILATMVDALLLLGPDRRVMVVNQAGRELTGRTQDELKGRDAAGLFNPGDDFAAVFDRVVTDGAVARAELTLRTRTDKAVPVAVSARLMKGPGDAVLGSVWVLRDVTEQSRARQALEASEREQRALAEGLTAANRELKHLSESKSDFVAAASHELRTPLTTIIEGIALTEDGTLGPVNHEQRTFLRLAREDAERLSGIIGKLLDVRRIELHRIEFKPARVEVGRVLRRVHAASSSYARDQGLTLTVELPDTPLIAWCDPEHLHRIVDNLLGNAIKFTLAGGRIVLSGAVTAGEPPGVMVKAKDTGIGIPADRHYRVFRQYERLEGEDQPFIEGTGLGLFLCKQLVEKNGGQIGFESVEHEGSTFYFTLPGAAPAG